MKKILLLILLITLIFSCGEDNSVLPIDETAFVALLVDENNNPISDAEICLMPDVDNFIHKIENDDKITVVELTSFSLKKVNNFVEVNWTTASEMNCKHFIIERANVINNEPESYQKIDTVKAKGNSMVNTNYTFIDSSVIVDNIYSYRLLIQDNDGSANYSNPFEISFRENKNFVGNCYPNPFYTMTSFPISMKKAGIAKVYFIEKSTGEAEFYELEFNAGMNTLNLSNTNNQGLPKRPGVYQIKMVLNDTTLYSPDMILDFKFTTTDCKIPQSITKSDINGKFSLNYKWFGDTTKFKRTQYNGIDLGEFILTTKRKIVARKLISEVGGTKEYLIGIDSITPIPNQTIEGKIIMKKYKVKG